MSGKAEIVVRSILITLASDYLLLPNALVAEIVDLQSPLTKDDAPDWFLGSVMWRGLSIPLVSFEGMMGESIEEPGQDGRCIVLNTLNERAAMTHIMILARDIPSLVQVRKDELEPADESADFGRLVKRALIIEGNLAIIPDMDEFERQVYSVLDAA